MADTMLDWLNTTLSRSTEKFMLLSHVYPGNNYFGGLEVFWDSQYLEKLHKILYEHNDRMVISMGAHTHKTQFQAPKSPYVPDDFNFV